MATVNKIGDKNRIIQIHYIIQPYDEYLSVLNLGEQTCDWTYHVLHFFMTCTEIYSELCCCYCCVFFLILSSWNFAKILAKFSARLVRNCIYCTVQNLDRRCGWLYAASGISWSTIKKNNTRQDKTMNYLYNLRNLYLIINVLVKVKWITLLSNTEVQSSFLVGLMHLINNHRELYSSRNNELTTLRLSIRTGTGETFNFRNQR